MTELSVVIPAYNEEVRLPASLESAATYLRGRAGAASTEIVVVDDGSADRTAERAEETASRLGLTLRVIRLPQNRGKGYAVRTGVLAASGERILISDADFSTPLAEWEKLAGSGAPVAIGSRGLDESVVREKQPFYRQSMGKLFNLLVRLLVIPGIHDTQCGFKLFSRDAARDVFSRAVVDRFAYDVESLLLARRLGHEIAEIPVLWFNSPDSRVSLLGGAQAFVELFLIRLRVDRRLRQERSGKH